MKKRIIIRRFTLLFCICCIGAVQAQQVQGTFIQPDTAAVESGEQLQNSLINQQPAGMGSMMLKTMLSLFIIIAVVYVMAVFFKRFVNKGGMTGRVGIHVVGTRYLSPKKQIYVVDVQDKRLVIGVTDTTISKLAEIEQTEELHEQQDSTGGTQHRPSFKSVLSSFTKRRES